MSDAGDGLPTESRDYGRAARRIRHKSAAKCLTYNRQIGVSIRQRYCDQTDARRTRHHRIAAHERNCRVEVSVSVYRFANADSFVGSRLSCRGRTYLWRIVWVFFAFGTFFQHTGL